MIVRAWPSHGHVQELFFIFLPYIALFHNLFWIMFVFDDGLQAWLDMLPLTITTAFLSEDAPGLGAHELLRRLPLQTKVAIFGSM